MGCRGALLMLGLVAGQASSATATCFEQAAQRYGISPALLQAIAKVESNVNPRALNTSHQERTGTVDIGLMQINSGHLPRLARYGITQERLLRDPCLNANVGAWLLAGLLSRYGADWNGVGAYNAACAELKGEECLAARRRYAWKVHLAMQSGESAMGNQQAARADLPGVMSKDSSVSTPSLRRLSIAGSRR